MKVVASLILGLVALLAIRWVLRDQFQRVITATTTDKAATCLQMLGNTTREEEGSAYIVGSIRNKCDQKFLSVTITFKLDRQSGSRSASQTMLPTYGTSSQRNQTPKFHSGSTFELPEAVISAYARDVKPGETREFKTAFRIPANSTYRFDSIKAF